jgi:hypothetical protein
MSWPWARKVLVPVAEAVTLGEAGGLAGAEAGALAEEGELGVAGALAGLEVEAAAELLEELQAVTSKAAQASVAQTVQPPACRALRAFVLNMNFHPCNFLSGSVSHPTHTTSAPPPWLGTALRGAVTKTVRHRYHGPRRLRRFKGPNGPGNCRAGHQRGPPGEREKRRIAVHKPQYRRGDDRRDTSGRDR